jgi:hypothetical protein
MNAPAYPIGADGAPLDLPHSLEAEQSLLGAVISDNERFAEVAGIIAPESFYRREHSELWRAIVALSEAGKPFDVVTIADALESAGRIEQAGGLSYLGTVVKETATPANARLYADIVAAKARRRQAMTLAADLAAAAADPTRDAAEVAQIAAQIADTAAPRNCANALRIIDMNRLRSAEIQPPAFLVRPLIPRGHLTLFGGHGGSGKSSLALVLGAHVAAGRDWAGLEVKRGRVLVASFEDREELVLFRLRAIADEYALSLFDIQAGMTIVDATEADAIVTEASAGGIRRVVPSRDGEALAAMVREQQPDLLIVDNASDSYDGEENNRRQVRAFIRYLVNTVKGHNGAALLLAHIDKGAAKFGSNRNSYSGSTGWHNSARSRIALIDDELRQEKLNVGKRLDIAARIAWTKAGVPVPGTSAAAVAARSAADAADDAALIACFRAAAEAGQIVPAADSGPSTTWHVLSAFPECSEALRADRPRLRAAVTRLLRGGAVLRETHRTPDRKTREKLTLVDCANARQSGIVESLAQTTAPPAPICAQGGMGGLARADATGGTLAQTDPERVEVEL